MPAIPNAGIGPKPKINNGLNNIFKKKLNINTFLKVTVSPSACNKELSATTEIKIIEPKNIIFVYSKPKLTTLVLDPINSNIFEAKNKPIKVTSIDKMIPYTIVCPK